MNLCIFTVKLKKYYLFVTLKLAENCTSCALMAIVYVKKKNITLFKTRNVYTFEFGKAAAAKFIWHLKWYLMTCFYNKFFPNENYKNVFCI